MPGNRVKALSDDDRTARRGDRSTELVFFFAIRRVQFAHLFEQRIDRQRIPRPTSVHADQHTSMLGRHVRRQRPATRVGDAQIAIAQHRLAANTGQHQTTTRTGTRRERARETQRERERPSPHAGRLRANREALLDSRRTIGKPFGRPAAPVFDAVVPRQRPRETNWMQHSARPDRLQRDARVRTIACVDRGATGTKACRQALPSVARKKAIGGACKAILGEIATEPP